MSPFEQTMAKATVALRDLKTKADETKDKAVVVLLRDPKAKATVVLNDLRTKSNETKDKAVVLFRDPQFQTCTIVTAGGAMTLGTVGGAFGLASGVVMGSSACVASSLHLWLVNSGWRDTRWHWRLVRRDLGGSHFRRHRWLHHLQVPR